jgi:hypothetical protein
VSRLTWMLFGAIVAFAIGWLIVAGALAQLDEDYGDPYRPR